MAAQISHNNEESLRALRTYNDNFKYIVKTVVIQKQSADGSAIPVQMSTQCYWNAATDGHIVYQYEENRSMSVIVSLFACAL